MVEPDGVASRAGSLPEENKTRPKDPEAQANQILEESEERTHDPATTDLDPDHVERRSTDELTPDEHLRSDTGDESA